MERLGLVLESSVCVEMSREEERRVCVTGAGGYVASWVVNLLLSKGYMVHGTVRDPDDEKNGHLKKLDKALENLQLFKANLLDYDSLRAAIAGCSGVFHVASPVPPGSVTNSQIELVEPAVTGTLNVLKACSEVGIKRVVAISSIFAVVMNTNWPCNKVMDEDCWSDEEYCKTTTDAYGWYSLAKTVAEKKALEYGEKNGLNVVTVCPSWVIGPLLQPTMNASIFHFVTLMKGIHETTEDRTYMMVDVRDIAEALLLAYEMPEASGRYICGPHPIRVQDLIGKLRSMYPNYNYPKNYIEVEEEVVKVSREKVKRLEWTYRPLEETLTDTVEYFQEAGLLSKD